MRKKRGCVCLWGGWLTGETTRVQCCRYSRSSETDRVQWNNKQIEENLSYTVAYSLQGVYISRDQVFNKV